MKKYIAICAAIVCCFYLSAQSHSRFTLYIPTDTEMQYFMNLYAKLKSIEEQTSIDELEALYQTFESGHYYETYQSLLFESYLLATRNQAVKDTMLSFFDRKKIHTDFAETLKRLYTSPTKRRLGNESKNTLPFNDKNTLFDENINFFTMNEVLTFNDTLGLMLFENDWRQASIDLPNLPKKKTQDFFLVCGGGTHSLKLSFKKLEHIDFETFKKQEIERNASYHDTSLKYDIFELPKEGILVRAGADRIYLAMGDGTDRVFTDVKNYSSILFLYSKKNNAGYVIHTFMNIASNNNNYRIRERLFHHIVFQSLLTFINK